MISDIFTAWSAAGAVWFLGAAVFACLRLVDVWRSAGWRVRWLVVGSILLCLGWGIHQADAAWLWWLDVYRPGAVRFSTWAYRACHMSGVLTLAYAVSYPRCGHWGWLGLLAVGLLVGLLAALT